MPGWYIAGTHRIKSGFVKSYLGPGDVVAGALGWWGLRAYSAAQVGSNAVRLRRDSDNVEQDFATIVGGGLSLAAIASFKGAANLFVRTWYDQTGNGFDLAQTTTAQQPALILSGFGSLPVLRFLAASNQTLTNADVTTAANLPAQPYSLSAFANRTGNTSAFNGVFTFRGATCGIYFDATAAVGLYSPTEVSAAEADGSFHTLQAAANGASSSIAVDGLITAGNAGANAGGPNTTFIGSDGGGLALTGDMTEVGIWSAIAFSAGQVASMNSNQRGYWGF